MMAAIQDGQQDDRQHVQVEDCPELVVFGFGCKPVPGIVELQ